MLAKINKSYAPMYWEDFFNDSLFNSFRSGRSNSYCPSANIIEDENEFRIELAVPGLSKKEIKVELDNDVMRIYYEHKEKKEDKESNYLKREFCHSSFERSFQLPDSIDRDKIKANHNEGVLNISLPKRKEVVSKAQKSIEIS